MTRGSTRLYADNIYLCFISSLENNPHGQLSIISNHIETLCLLEGDCIRICDEVLQIEGLGDQWRGGDNISKRIHEAIALLEEMLCYAMSDIAELRIAYSEGQLLFQHT